MWSSIYLLHNNNLAFDITLGVVEKKYNLIKKNISREYIIREQDISDGLDNIKYIIKNVFNNNPWDNNGLTIYEKEIDDIACDLFIISVLTYKKSIKKNIIKKYLRLINNNNEIVNQITKEIITLIKEHKLIRFPCYFIEDIIFDQENKREATVVGIQFL